MKNVTLDHNQDFVFRFRIPQGHQRLERSLDEFYRTQVLEMARILQFHFQGQRVDIDSFSFRNDPNRIINILPPLESPEETTPTKQPQAETT